MATRWLIVAPVNSRSWLQADVQKNPFRRNQYGFTLGGPVRIPKVFNGRDRLFFMSNSEELRDRTTSQVSAGVATAAMRDGDFTFAGFDIFDPLSRAFNSRAPEVSGRGSSTTYLRACQAFVDVWQLLFSGPPETDYLGYATHNPRSTIALCTAVTPNTARKTR